jgi:hypothetical protein
MELDLLQKYEDLLQLPWALSSPIVATMRYEDLLQLPWALSSPIVATMGVIVATMDLLNFSIFALFLAGFLSCLLFCRSFDYSDFCSVIGLQSPNLRLD